MRLIHITQTATEKLKRLAKLRRSSNGTSLAVALDAISKENGFDNWKHVTTCLTQTSAAQITTKQVKALPEHLVDLLQGYERNSPASTESRNAFAHGFIFAMDVKDAQDINLSEDYSEANDAWYLAAKDIWPVVIHSISEGTGESLLDTRSQSELQEIVLDDGGNNNFFRYSGKNPPKTIEDAYANVMKMSFFSPFYMWINGEFIDMAEVKEIRVNGSIVLKEI